MASRRSRSITAARERLISGTREALTAELYRRGHTPKSLEETQRDVLWWTYARVQALQNLRPGLLGGWGVAWTSAGYAELVPIQVPRPGRDRVAVEVIASAISAGTERAQYLKLPNAQLGVLGRPGYSAAGKVIARGRRATSVREGELVAVTAAPHASVVTVSERQVFQVPAGVSAGQASLVMLGTICTHGVALAEIGPEDRVAAVGAGPIGALAFRIACLRGTPLAMVATTRRHVGLAEASGVPLLRTEQDQRRIARLGADVVIEATGDPDAVGIAVEAAAPGARILLLGSPRGITRDLPAQQIREKRLTLIGAHVDTLELDTARIGSDARRATAESFLKLLASGQLKVEDLVGPAIDPRRASVFYRELAEGSRVGVAHFDWTSLRQEERVHRARLLAPPNLTGRGMEPGRAHRPGRREPRGLFELGDPFAGAHGLLRLGLLGCGDIAVHNAAGAAVAPNVRVEMCFDPNRRLAEDLASRHGARAARTEEELLTDPNVDAVLLCVPHHLHAPLAIEACRAGKHVVVEKPLAKDLQGALAIVDAARGEGVRLSVCFPQRYEPKVQIARRLIEAGALGALGGSLTRLFLDKSPAYWLGGFSGRAQSDWRRSVEKAGGGVLIMNLSHHLDLVRYLTGVEVQEVTAFVSPPDTVEDAVVAALSYSNGALGSLIGSSSVTGSTEQELSLWGEEGRIILEPEPRVYSHHPLEGLRTTRWNEFGRLPAARIRAIDLSRLATALSNGRKPDVSGEDGLAVQAIIEAVYRSAAAQAPIDTQELILENQRVPEAVR